MSDRDLFDDSTMSFGEHLEELRKCLIKAILGVALGAVVGFLIGGWVIGQIKAPLIKTLNRYEQYAAAAAADLERVRPLLEEARTLRERAIEACELIGEPTGDLPEI